MFFVDWSNVVHKNTCRIIVYAAMWAWSFSGARTAAAAESRPKGGCCNRRLSCLMGDVAKFFQTPSPGKHAYLRSKQQPTIDNSAEAPHAERVPLSNETSDLFGSLVKCNIVSDYRTLIDDLWRIIEFADWLHDEALEISPSAE